ncbi:unnamed protein product [marine sediment metagenome]|uniref:Uncharacterized protein n=1 Tax=marine sediment metagenome TaxID=412755 RepID=X1CSU7_9ZZZZ
MKRLSYAERLQIPLQGSEGVNFYSKEGLLLATGYTRVVIGGRGPYIEFDSSHVVREAIHVPKHALHKLQSTLTYYHEYRSNDKCFVKLYYQQMGVSYADYQEEMWYISPSDLKTDDIDDLLLPPYPSDESLPSRQESFRDLFGING